MRLGAKILFFILPVCLLQAGTALCAAPGITYEYNSQNPRLEQKFEDDGTDIKYYFDANGNIVTKTAYRDSAPYAPTNSSSFQNGATNVSRNTYIYWTGNGDPEGDPIVYDLYLGTSSQPGLVASGLADANYYSQNLSCGTTYYWSVKVTDAYGHSTQGPVWNFTTAPASDLALSLTSSQSKVKIGTNLVYTVTVTNNGPNPAAGVVVTDRLPAEVSLVSASASQGVSCTNSNGNLTCSLASLQSGAQATIAITVRPFKNGLFPNSPSVTTTGCDPTSANDTDLKTTTVNGKDSNVSLLLSN